MPPPKISTPPPDIRWPNDLISSRGRTSKFCGILTEMHAEPDRIHYAVVGIGINVNQTKMPARISRRSPRRCASRPASSFAPRTPDPVAAPFRPLLQSVSRRGARPILRRFAQVSSYFEGKRVRITTATETFTGITAGLEPSGVLRVARDDGRGIEAVLSGDVAEAS